MTMRDSGRSQRTRTPSKVRRLVPRPGAPPSYPGRGDFHPMSNIEQTCLALRCHGEAGQSTEHDSSGVEMSLTPPESGLSAGFFSDNPATEGEG